MAYIEITNITFNYPDTQEPAIRNLSLKIQKGQFVVLFGASGSGKSTLLRLLKKEIQPYGKLTGAIKIDGKLLEGKDCHTGQIGFVFQDPENQVVAEDVLHELVFGLENIGLSTNEMRNRIAEMVHFFGAQSLLNRKSYELSGGKKQQINLASVLLMQPQILLLDEPTSQLDPVSARELLDMLKRLNEEFGMTIILAEHRLEEVFTLADHIIMMEKGKVLVEGSPKQALRQVWDSPYPAFVPTIPAQFFRSDGQGDVPLTIKEGRKWIQGTSLKLTQPAVRHPIETLNNQVLKVKNTSFRYEKKAEFILKEINFSLQKGEIYALMGGNGSGKSTLLKVIAGLLKPEHGKLELNGKPFKSYKLIDQAKKIGYLPQNPKLFFIQDTVGKELEETIVQWGIENKSEVEKLKRALGIEHLLTSHPYDISGGELQKAALACLLLRKPEILLLDEPTKGLDPISKQNLAKILAELQAEGMTLLLSTHDVEFAANYATRCGMLFQGGITAEDDPQHFFKGNFFYTTMLQRLFQGYDAPLGKSLEEDQPCASHDLY